MLSYALSFCLDQSQYSYAYEHAFIGTSPPMSASSAHSPAKAPTDEAGGAYETPDENVVNEFMEDIQEKRAATAAYETADEQAVAGFVSSLKRKHTLNGLQCGKHHSLHFHCCTSGCLIGTDPDIRHYYYFFVYCLKNCESICVKSKALEDTLNFLMFLKRYLGLEIEIFLTSQLQL